MTIAATGRAARLVRDRARAAQSRSDRIYRRQHRRAPGRRVHAERL